MKKVLLIGADGMLGGELKERLEKNYDVTGTTLVTLDICDREAVINKAKEIVRSGNILGIYPEGTRHPSGPPHKAKSGIAYIALDTKSNILPVCIYREGKYSWFKKTTIRIGKVLEYNELVNEELTPRANIKNIVDTVTKEITQLWEMKH